MTLLLITIVALLGLAADGVYAADVPLWKPQDLVFNSNTKHDNPFKVDFEATATSQDGKTLRISGFYDGGTVWKIRFAPTARGNWTIKTTSSDPELNAKTLTVKCSGKPEAGVRGPLKIDPKHPRHFLYEDGSRFFLMGYECDWLWALDTTKPNLPTVNSFLKKLSGYGFNYILLNIYAHDTRWKPGTTEPRDYGPPPIFPWVGTNESPDHSQLNLVFWQHYDKVIEAMMQHGITAHIMIKVYNKYVNWPERLSLEDDLYFRTVIARYAAFPNVVWDFSKESCKEGSQDYKVNRIKFIHDTDPYRRLKTMHDDDEGYDNNLHGDRLNYRTQHKTKAWREDIVKIRAQKEWPVANMEFGYEWGPKGPDDVAYPKSQSPEENLKRAWEVYMAGGYGAYYYTWTAWDIIRADDNPPGYVYFGNLKTFFESTDYWLLEPNDSLVSEGYCLANPGFEYVVCQVKPEQFTLNLQGNSAKYSAEWFNPFTGQRKSAGILKSGEHTITPPNEWADLFVLHVKKTNS